MMYSNSSKYGSRSIPPIPHGLLLKQLSLSAEVMRAEIAFREPAHPFCLISPMRQRQSIPTKQAAAYRATNADVLPPQSRASSPAGHHRSFPPVPHAEKYTRKPDRLSSAMLRSASARRTKTIRARDAAALALCVRSCSTGGDTERTTTSRKCNLSGWNVVSPLRLEHDAHAERQALLRPRAEIGTLSCERMHCAASPMITVRFWVYFSACRELAGRTRWCPLGWTLATCGGEHVGIVGAVCRRLLRWIDCR